MAKKGIEKIQVHERSLLARLNRRLLDDGLIVKKNRMGSSGSYGELGQFYVVNLNTSYVHDTDIDLEKWGRKYDALKRYEELA